MLSTLISYSREDAEFATRLAADLRAAGAGVSLAPLDAAAGDRRRGATENALARCTGWLVVLSPAAIRSASFDVDVAVASGRGIPIVAILCRDCEIPPRLRGAERVDFRTDYAGGLQGLVAKIGPANGPAIAASRAQPPAPSRPDAPTSKGDQAPAAPPTGRALRNLGSALLALAVLGFLFVISLPKVMIDPVDGWQLVGVGLVVDFLVAFAGVKALKRGKQLGALSAQALLAQDRRPPVVYLRSFDDDFVADEGSTKMLPHGGGALMGIFMSLLDSAGGVATEEEQLAEALRDVGPFVAVGKPGEKLPQLGAARMYVQDSEWQGVVRKLMARAALVVLRAGKTEGLWWEIQTAAETVRPERIVLLLPYDRERYALFRSRAAACFGRALPDYPTGKVQGHAGSVQGIVYFEPDGTPRFVQPQGFYRTAKPWVRTFQTTLQPVFGQLGVHVVQPKASAWKVLMWVLLAPIVAVVAVFLVGGAIVKAIDLLGF